MARKLIELNCKCFYLLQKRQDLLSYCFREISTRLVIAQDFMEMRKEYSHPFAAICLASISTCQLNVPIESSDFPLPFLKNDQMVTPPPGHSKSTCRSPNILALTLIWNTKDIWYCTTVLFVRKMVVNHQFFLGTLFQPTPCLHDPLAAKTWEQAANPRSEERRRLIGTISCQPRSRN